MSAQPRRVRVSRDTRPPAHGDPQARAETIDRVLGRFQDGHHLDLPGVRVLRGLAENA